MCGEYTHGFVDNNRGDIGDKHQRRPKCQTHGRCRQLNDLDHNDDHDNDVDQNNKNNDALGLSAIRWPRLRTNNNIVDGQSIQRDKFV